MARVIPRWEWRTFGDGFAAAEARLAAASAVRVEERLDVYVLSATSDASVKVRDGRMDVKRLEAVDDEGFEQWRPVMNAAFPLAAGELDAVLAALGAARASGSGASTLDDLVAASPDLRVVPADKRRAHYTYGGCRAEISELRTDAGTTRTLAVESEDPARVSAAVHELGMAGRSNVCMARGLKALVGMGAHRYAVIDVGTNSVKFHIGERRADGDWRRVADRAEVTRLGEGLDRTGRLGAAPIARTVEAIAGMAEEARRSGAETIAAVGTAGMRLAPNAGELVDAVRERCGVEIVVIDGDEEARLAYRAATAGLGASGGSLAVFDTGGGSSQFTFGRDGRVQERFSLNVGAARFTERYGLDGAVSAEELATTLSAIAADLAPVGGRPAPDAVVGMGGAVTNLAAVALGLEDYDPDRVQGTVLDRAEIERQIELYRTQTAEQRRAIAGLQPNRAEVILAGACIVQTVISLLGRDALTVSDRGLRHGLIAERFALGPVSAAGTR
jgi:exopolyphosphatase / guanosine-5'-triphosphate,3'-diphosphate pyrophosphatase